MAREIKTEFAKALKIEGIIEVAKLKGVFVVPLMVEIKLEYIIMVKILYLK